MIFTHIRSSKDKEQIKDLNHHIKKGKPTFVLIYMEGCGPCNATRPEWGKLENVLSSLKNDKGIMIADVDQSLLDHLDSIKEKPMGFPTMLYIQGNQVENYEGGRTIADFVKWIKEKNSNSVRQKMQTHTQKGGKKRKSNKKSNRKTKKNRIKIGGLVEQNNKVNNPKFDKFHISNLEIIFFIMEFLNKSDLKNILLSHHHFINTIQEQKLDFKQNQEFRLFVNNIIQWFLLDYDKDFFNAILEIIKNTIMNPVFLNKNINWDERYNVLLENIYHMIEKYNNINTNIFVLLEIILRALRMPDVREKIIKNINQQENTILSFKNTIVCLLNVLIKEDLIHIEKINLGFNILTQLDTGSFRNLAILKELILR
jgi:hypothetical protein